MLEVRRQLRELHDETVQCLLTYGRDSDDDCDPEFDWPYETFFRFDPEWSQQDIAQGLTWEQWLRLMVDESDIDQFQGTEHLEWELAISATSRSGRIYTFYEYVMPEGVFNANEFWSLERWCKACDVEPQAAKAVLAKESSLAI